MESWVTRVKGFLPTNCQRTKHFRSRLMVRHGTDGQTDNGHHCVMPHPLGAGGI